MRSAAHALAPVASLIPVWLIHVGRTLRPGTAALTLACGFAAAIALAPRAWAEASYTYTGPELGLGALSYETPGSGLSPASFVSATLTFASPLADDLQSFTDLSNGINVPEELPTRWRVSDGVRTWTQANSRAVTGVVDTDSQGNITGWDFDFYSKPSRTHPALYPGLANPEV